MAKITGVGATLQIGTADDGGSTAAGSDTFTTIGGVNSFSGPTGDKGEAEVTDLGSSGREFLATIPDYGEVSFTGFHDVAQATQNTLWADFTDADDTHIRNYRITFTDSSSFDFQGYVKTLSNSAEIDSGVPFNGSIRISGGITRTTS